MRRAQLLMVFDSAAAAFTLVAVLLGTNLERMPDGIDNFLSLRVSLKNVLLLATLGVAWPLIFRLGGLYDAQTVRRFKDEASRVVGACSLGTLLAVLFPMTSGSGAFQFHHLFYFWLGSSATGVLVRSLHRALFRRSGEQRRVLIVGSGSRAMRVYRNLNDEECASEIVGFVDSVTDHCHSDVIQRMLGPLDQLEDILMRHVVDEVFITLPVKSQYHAIHDAIQVCERAGVRAKYSADIFDSVLAWPQYEAVEGNPIVAMNVVPNDYRLIIKRALDIAGAVTGLTLLAPVMLAAAVAVKLTSPGAVIFAQERYGLNKRRFKMYKFRTMVSDAEELQKSLEDLNQADGPVFKIADDPRITRVGKFLRRSSIDELPQLINVLKGEMSLVGPRPLPLRDVGKFTRPSDMRRFSVRPGVTCLWQVHGRNDVKFSKWIELDLEYIDSWSLALDLTILLRTVPAVWKGTGAN